MSSAAEIVGALTYEQTQRERTAVVESAASGGAGPAPADAQYVVLALNATLTQERVLTGTADQIVVTDNGAGSTVVLSLDSNPIIPGANTPDRVLFTNGAGAVATDSVLKYSTTTNLLDVALGYLQVSQKASGSGVPIWLVRLVGAINSGITSGTEAPAILIDLSAQQTWTTNLPTTQRAVVFTAPNYDSTGLSVGANAATLAIENEPGFGPNSVYSHVWALWVQAGATGLGGGLSVGNLAALTGQPTLGQIRSSALTATRVVFVGASNDLTDDADFTFNGAQLALAVQGATGGLLVGTDVQWYRSAANTWRTPDAVIVDSTLTVSTMAAGATDTVVTHSTGLLQTRTIDSRVWGSTLVDGSGAAAQVTYWTDANTVTGSANFTYDGTTVTVADSHATTTPALALTQASTGDAALRWALATTASYAAGIDNSDSDKWQLAYAASGTAVLGTNPMLTILGSATEPRAAFFGTATDGKVSFDFITDTFPGGRDISASLWTNSSAAPLMLWNKSRGTSIGSFTVVQSGDALGNFEFRGADGDQFISGASFRAVVDGTPGDNDMPGRLEFRTTPDGSTSLAVRMVVKNNGNVGVGATITTASGGGTPVLLMDQASGNPTGLPSNTAGIFTKDVAGTCELFGVDEGGAVTQLTPHASDGPPELYGAPALMRDIVIHDLEQYTGVERWTNLSRMAIALEWALGELAALGRKVPAEYLPLAVMQKSEEPLPDWDAHQAYLVAEAQAELFRYNHLTPEEQRDYGAAPRPVTAKAAPAWLAAGRELSRKLPPGKVTNEPRQSREDPQPKT